MKAGLTPQKALAAATRDAARGMQLNGDLGTLEPGKWPDFVVLAPCPLADISDVRGISPVWLAGDKVAH
ncbi:MAG: amidohydrolase family protein [Gemmatimonadaceae bacterium]